jgi:ABC-type hemin transport system ATPase subunit
MTQVWFIEPKLWTKTKLPFTYGVREIVHCGRTMYVGVVTNRRLNKVVFESKMQDTGASALKLATSYCSKT